MSRHRAPAGKAAMDAIDVITASIPLSREAHEQHLTDRREQMLGQYATWCALNEHWGHINHLIGAINDVNFLLGIKETLPEGLW